MLKEAMFIDKIPACPVCGTTKRNHSDYDLEVLDSGDKFFIFFFRCDICGEKYFSRSDMQMKRQMLEENAITQEKADEMLLAYEEKTIKKKMRKRRKSNVSKKSKRPRVNGRSISKR